MLLIDGLDMAMEEMDTVGYIAEEVESDYGGITLASFFWHLYCGWGGWRGGIIVMAYGCEHEALSRFLS